MAKQKNQGGLKVQKNSSAKTRNGGSYDPGFRQNPKNSWLLLGMALLITLLVFYPAVNYDFVNWDDDQNITINQNVQNLNTESIRNMFSTTVTGGYTPLTSVTFALEHHFFGLNPKVYHFNNILLHLICMALVFFLLKQVGASLFITFTVTLLFGIHPMRVESVAWITERKDTLYTLFFLLSLMAYIFYRQKGNIRYYLLSIFIFVFSLLSKIQAVTLPLVLILTDYYLDKKFDFRKLWNKIPFFILSLFTGLAGIYFLSEDGSLDTGTILPIYQRLFIGSYSLMVYLVKSLLPYELSAIYPSPSSLSAMHYISMPLVLGLAFMIWKVRRNRIEIITGTLFFLFNVMFMLQVVGAGQGYLADRFTYVAYTGLFFVYAFLAEKAFQGKWKATLYTGGIIYLLILSLVAHQRVKVWENTETLFTDVIQKYPGVPVSYNNMGKYFRELNQYEKAIELYTQAIELDPSGYQPYNNRGKALFDLGRTDDALKDFNRSIELNGAYSESRSNRGAILASRKEFGPALEDLGIALELEPGHLSALSNRSLAYFSMNQFDKAIDDVNTYLQYKPDDADLINLRSMSYSMLNRDREALEDLNRAIQLVPSQGIFWQNRSFLLNKMGDRKGAIRDIEKAQSLGVKVNPAYLQMLSANP